MHTSDLPRLYVSVEKSFNQATLIEARSTNVTHDDTKPQFEILPDGVLFLGPICFMIVWALVVIIVSGGSKVTGDINRKGTINRFQQIPCGNCRFFKDNHYLKCAVNPSTVLTKQAIDCSDYWPN